jgi:hypothetical protein
MCVCGWLQVDAVSSPARSDFVEVDVAPRATPIPIQLNPLQVGGSSPPLCVLLQAVPEADGHLPCPCLPVTPPPQIRTFFVTV